MELIYEDLIDRYNLGELSEDEKELFWLTIEYNDQLRQEFKLYLKIKYFVIEGNVLKFIEFIEKHRLK